MYNPANYETTEIDAADVRPGMIAVINGDEADLVSAIRSGPEWGGVWIKGGGQTRLFSNDTPVTVLFRDRRGRIIPKH